MDTFVFSEPQEHAEFVISGLEEMRQHRPELCDFSILIENETLACHRSILCLFSKFFRGTIRGNFKESSENVSRITNVPLDDMKTILDFTYTGTLKLHHASVESLLNTATLLEFTKVVEICLEYIHHQIDNTNCLDILKLAKSRNYSSLQISAQRHLISHVFEVFNNEIDTTIELTDLKDLLENPMSHKDSEESLIMTVLTWLEHDFDERSKDAESLMNKIQWKRIPCNFLLKLLANDTFLQSHRNIKQMVLDHIRQSLNLGRKIHDDAPSSDECSNKKYLKSSENSSSSSSASAKDPGFNFDIPKSAHQALLLVGGLNLAEAERGDTSQPNVVCYMPHSRTWKTRSAWPERGLRGFSVSKFNSNVVVTGGSSTTARKHFVINRAWIYNVFTDTWKPLPDMNKCRSFHCSCGLNNRLYTIGGTGTGLLEVEYYDEHKNSWTMLKQSAPKVMYNFTASACNSKLIVIGSTYLHNIFVQIYNPAVNTWTVARSPNVPRHLSAPVSATSDDESRIYISGDNTKKMYMFLPNSNTWCRAEDMNSLHSNGSLMSLGSELVHTGGHWKDDSYWDELEIYNPHKNSWKPHGALPHLWLYHGCAAVYVDF